MNEKEVTIQIREWLERTEFFKSFAFVRNIWHGRKKREDMTQLKIGILLSSINDKDKDLKELLLPKIFVIRYNIKSGKGKWGQQWTKL
jgi:hypothetical protein